MLETYTRLHFSIPAFLRASSKDASLSLCIPTPLVKNICLGIKSITIIIIGFFGLKYNAYSQYYQVPDYYLLILLNLYAEKIHNINLMIAIIDYGMGNLRSVEKGFLKVGADVKVTNKPEDVGRADGVVLPGVGAFKDCMRELSNLELVDVVIDSIKKGKPYLGICLGLQVLFSESDEFGKCRGLDIFSGKVVKFEFGAKELKQEPNSSHLTNESELMNLKVPQMGWNQLNIKNNNPLFKGIPDNSYFYFVHSYYVVPDDEKIISTTTDYGVEFTSSIYKDNIYAVQFHPEKSQALGLRLLENFGRIVYEK